MKKIMFSIMVVGCVFLLTGCGLGNKVVCTGTTEESGYKVGMKVTATLKGNKVDKVSASMSFDNKETADTFCSILKLANTYAEDGKKIDFSCSGKSITIKDYTQLVDSSDEKLSDITKEDFIKAMESEKLKCK